MNIDDLYITNYREAGGLPLHSITHNLLETLQRNTD